MAPAECQAPGGDWYAWRTKCPSPPCQRVDSSTSHDGRNHILSPGSLPCIALHPKKARLQVPRLGTADAQAGPSTVGADGTPPAPTHQMPGGPHPSLQTVPSVPEVGGRVTPTEKHCSQRTRSAWDKGCVGINSQTD